MLMMVAVAVFVVDAVVVAVAMLLRSLVRSGTPDSLARRTRPQQRAQCDVASCKDAIARPFAQLAERITSVRKVPSKKLENSASPAPDTTGTHRTSTTTADSTAGYSNFISIPRIRLGVA